MHTLLSRAATAAAACVVLVACTSAPTAATASPTRAPLPASASLPVGRSAREIEEDVLLAPGPDGTLLVSIPTATGSVLALLDGEGMPLPGWPIAMRDSCNLLQPLDGGSVLVVCHTLRFEPPADVRAFAFEPGGHPRAAWPVQLGRGVPFTGRMVGDVLTLAVGDYDTVPTVSVLQVTPDGAIRRGTAAAHECCYGWTVGPDGTAYGSLSDPSSRQDSLITAVDSVGLQDGWPVLFDGRGSAPALAPDGRIVVAAGPFNGDSSRVVVFDRTGNGVAATSADLPLKVVWPIGAGDVDCGPAGRPQAPIIGNDGTIFVWSELDDAVLALDRSLAIRPGWPFEPSRPLQRRSYLDPRAELSCSSLAIPAVGPDGTLYLPLQARDETVGGSLVEVGSDRGDRVADSSAAPRVGQPPRRPIGPGDRGGRPPGSRSRWDTPRLDHDRDGGPPRLTAAADGTGIRRGQVAPEQPYGLRRGRGRPAPGPSGTPGPPPARRRRR